MHLRNGAEPNLSFFDLEGDQRDSLKSAHIHVERASGDLLRCNIVVHRKLDDVSCSALDFSHDKKAQPKGGTKA